MTIEKFYDAGGGVNAPWADPAEQVLGIRQTEVSDPHCGQDGDTDVACAESLDIAT